MNQQKQTSPAAITSTAVEQTSQGPVELSAELLNLVSGGTGEDANSPKGGWRGMGDVPSNADADSPKGGW
jgi:hypothetical protein